MSTFVLPFGPCFLLVTVQELPHGDYHDEQIIEVDLFADKACTRVLAEDLEWKNLDGTDFDLFAELRSKAIDRDERARRREEALRDCPPALRAELDRDLANALILGKALDSIFQRRS